MVVNETGYWEGENKAGDDDIGKHFLDGCEAMGYHQTCPSPGQIQPIVTVIVSQSSGRAHQRSGKQGDVRLSTIVKANSQKKTSAVARVVHGEFSEHAKTKALAEEHDIVINVGSSGDDSVTEAIMEGLKKRPAKSKSVLIHMSGTGNFLNTHWNDGSHHSESKVWSVNDSIEDMKAINPGMFQGGPAALVLTLNKTHPHIATYIVFPSAIFGESAGPIRALGVIQLLMYQKAKELGFIPYIGDGTAIANQIHVDAVTHFMLKVLDLSLKPSAPQGSQYERAFFIGGPDIAWREVSETFAKAFHAKGIIASPNFRSVSLAEAGESPLPTLMSHEMLRRGWATSISNQICQIISVPVLQVLFLDSLRVLLETSKTGESAVSFFAFDSSNQTSEHWACRYCIDRITIPLSQCGECSTKRNLTYDSWQEAFVDTFMPNYSAVGYSYRIFDGITEV
ncbi:hypothetical protein B7494_g7180 [Chlorociboria aeruginascens]|nr:hypothetical protein B7494_g7180 [Chlorociboria aeruginascens]